MKNILKTLFVALITIFSIASLINLSVYSPVNAAGESTEKNCRYFIGMPSWDCHTIEEPQDQNQLTSNIVTIASNVFSSITVISTYLVICFVIYGGYLYMFSSGDPAKAIAARKVLTRAFIGLAIILLSNVILNSIRFALVQNKSFADVKGIGMKDAETILKNGINWIIGVSGVVCVVFIIIGAIGYMTSAGDSAKLQKAKNTLLYSLIGLAIVALSGIITNFVFYVIDHAEEENGLINQTVIAKELNEN